MVLSCAVAIIALESSESERKYIRIQKNKLSRNDKFKIETFSEALVSAIHEKSFIKINNLLEFLTVHNV